ncbi:MAG: hypothetical protein E6K81_06570, partial [Candidatus Eisenbacteria bacterium]
KAVAGEAGVPFFSMSGSDFVEMFVGVGASVTGDTPVLIRRDGKTCLMPIGEFVDGYFTGDEQGSVVPVAGVETLGFEGSDSNFEGSPRTSVTGSAWSRVRGVLRHRVAEVYEIEYLGGVIRTTGDHSVFVRTPNTGIIQPVAARDLRPGDLLVELPADASARARAAGASLALGEPARSGASYATATSVLSRASHPAWVEAGEAPVIQRVSVKPFDGYVYDLCGCDNEAFFGGESPVLLHNSRVRDLFEQAKRNAPCLTGDAVVTLSGGRQVTIAEMFEKQMVGVRVPAMADEFRFEDVNVIGITKKPAEEVLRISTATSEIKATPNHLFPVLRDGLKWVRADELATDDYVAAPRSIATDSHPPLFYDFLSPETLLTPRGEEPLLGRLRLADVRDRIGRIHPRIERLSSPGRGLRSSWISRVPLYLDEDVAYLCGLITSDGSWRGRGGRQLIFVNTELALHERVAEILRLHFDYSPKRHLNAKHFENLLPQGKTPATLKDCYTTFISSRFLCDALSRVQASILEMPSYIVGAWLRGVFDGDGHVRPAERDPRIVLSAWDRVTGTTATGISRSPVLSS